MDKINKFQIKINSILGGFSSSFLLSGEDQYLDASGIDPESILGTGLFAKKTIGALMPSFSSPILTSSTLGGSHPMWISGSSATSGVFVYGANGSIYALNSSLGLLGDGSQWNLATGEGNGMSASGNYMYFSTNTDIARLGALNAAGPTMIDNFWASSDNGLGQAVLTDNDYPATYGLNYPNHVLYTHNDGYTYIADYANGQGMIHSFMVTAAGATTATYQDLNLPPGLIPTDIKSYGTDLAILCCSAGGTAYITRGGISALVLWDTVSDNFYKVIPINEILATALINKNGELHVIAGGYNTDVKLLKYLGGESFQTLSVINDSSPCPASAVDSLGNTIFFGGYISQPARTAGVFSYGYRSGLIKSALHMPLKITGYTDYPTISCVKCVNNSAYPVYGWRTATDGYYGLSAVGTSGAQSSRWRSRIFNIGERFVISRIKIPLINAVAAGDSITVTVYVDNQAVSTALQAINQTNFSSQRIIDFNSLNIKGYNNFYLDVSFDGTNVQGFGFPITIYIETYEF